MVGVAVTPTSLTPGVLAEAVVDLGAVEHRGREVAGRRRQADGERGRQLVLQGCKDMPDFPWVKPEEFIHHCGSDIVTINHRTAIGRWVELGRLDIVYKVPNNDTLIL